MPEAVHGKKAAAAAFRARAKAQRPEMFTSSRMEELGAMSQAATSVFSAAGCCASPAPAAIGLSAADEALLLKMRSAASMARLARQLPGAVLPAGDAENAPGQENVCGLVAERSESAAVDVEINVETEIELVNETLGGRMAAPPGLKLAPVRFDTLCESECEEDEEDYA